MQILGDFGVPNEQWLQWGAVIGASLLAAVMDVRCGRIPNVLTLSLWLGGLARAMFSDGAGGLGAAIGVSALLALPYIVLFVIAGGGAGDAKLMGAIGAWLPLREAVVVFCCVAVTGMVLALLRMTAHRERKNFLLNTVASFYVLMIACCGGPRGPKSLAGSQSVLPDNQTGHISLPYGVAILLGVCSAAVGVRIWPR